MRFLFLYDKKPIIMEWYLKVINNYRNFDGRARRKEYWMFVLINLMFSLVAAFLDRIFGIAWADVGYGPLNFIYGLILFIPSLAVLIRRLHDIGKSGWMLLIAFIPLIGVFWLLFLLVTDSSPGENQYGNNPKEISI